MSNNVTQEYLDGIREARSLLKSIRDRGEKVTRADAKRFMDNCSENLKRGFDKPLADMFRGERDFWKNQILSGTI